MIRLFKHVFAGSIPFLLVACTSGGPKRENLPILQADVLILGGSVAGLSAAAAVRDFDENISIILTDPNANWVAEPFVALYLVNKIDKKLVFTPFEQIARQKGYRFIQDEVESVDEAEHTVYLKRSAIRYRALIDLHYQNSAAMISPSSDKLESLKSALSDSRVRTIRIDAGNSPDEIGYRARELSYLLKQKYTSASEKEVLLKIDPTEDREENQALQQDDTNTLLISYAVDFKDGGVVFGSSFFGQYNLGQEKVSDVLKTYFNLSYFPNLVDEDQVILTDALKLKAIDVKSGEIINGTRYLAKVKKINNELTEGR